LHDRCGLLTLLVLRRFQSRICKEGIWHHGVLLLLSCLHLCEDLQVEAGKSSALQRYGLNTESNLVIGAEYAKQRSIQQEITTLQHLDQRELVDALMKKFKEHGSLQHALGYLGHNTESDFVRGAQYAQKHRIQKTIQQLQKRRKTQRQVVDELMKKFKESSNLQKALNYLEYSTEANHVGGAKYAQKHNLETEVQQLQNQGLNQREMTDELMNKFKEHANLQKALNYLGHTTESNYVQGAKYAKKHNIPQELATLQKQGLSQQQVVDELMKTYPEHGTLQHALGYLGHNTESHFVRGSKYAKNHNIENEIQQLQTQGLSQRQIVDKLMKKFKEHASLDFALHYLGHTTESLWVQGAKYAQKQKEAGKDIEQEIQKLQEQGLEPREVIDELMKKFTQHGNLHAALAYLGHTTESNWVQGIKYAKEHRIQQTIEKLQNQGKNKRQLVDELMKKFQKHSNLQHALSYLGHHSLARNVRDKTRTDK